MRHVVRFAASVLLVALAASACTIEASDLEATEERYLDRIRAAVRPLVENTKAFDEIYQQNTTSRSRFVEQLEDVPVQSRIIRVFRSLQRIRPPTRFFNDQRRLLEALIPMSPTARTGQELADDEQVIKASTRFAHTVVLYQRALTQTSGRFCNDAATSATERDLCDPLGILPGAGYGQRLHAALADGAAEFVPRAFTFVGQSWSNQDVAAYLDSIGPALVDAVEEIRDDVKALVPTDEFAADQRVLEAYFDDLVRVSTSIANAAKSNPARLRTLFPESQRIVREAAEELSEDIRPAVAVWFFPTTEE